MAEPSKCNKKTDKLNHCLRCAHVRKSSQQQRLQHVIAARCARVRTHTRGAFGDDYLEWQEGGGFEREGECVSDKAVNVHYFSSQQKKIDTFNGCLHSDPVAPFNVHLRERDYKTLTPTQTFFIYTFHPPPPLPPIGTRTRKHHLTIPSFKHSYEPGPMR